MDDHAQSNIPYPPEATGTERKMLQAFAAMGIVSIAGLVGLMGLAMYLLPGAPTALLAVPLP
jgi:hypothetical protein